MRKIRKAVFSVAGLGTRFLSATKTVSKEMLTVVYKSVIQYFVNEAREADIEILFLLLDAIKQSLKIILMSKLSYI
ncbi:UTP-glucose-1-phosphate uridylyltransferase [Bartonella callosciuri]|uniref:UTP-glucose-1-phosphate uridylyltransferase n=1 Tax=Bartonella callosciuri TaxID=686223 RepID=A0A840NP64_9HYPH|nr:UTP-glucose-1-phosphate uridylyltransferase [Bartonella callosciuri]